MIIQCDKCLTKFKLDDSKLKPQGVKVKCKKCANIFTVYPERHQEEPKAAFQEESLKLTPQGEGKDISFELPSFEMTFEEKDFTTKKQEEETSQSQPREEFSWDQFHIDFEEKKEEVLPREAETSQKDIVDFSLENVSTESVESVIPKEDEIPQKEEDKEEISFNFDFDEFVKEAERVEEGKEEGSPKSLEEFFFEETVTEEKPKEEEFGFEIVEKKEGEESFSQTYSKEEVGEDVTRSTTLFEDSQIVQTEEQVELETTREQLDTEVTFEEKKESVSIEDGFKFIEGEEKEGEKDFVFKSSEEDKVKKDEEVVPPLEFEPVQSERPWLTYLVALLLIVVLSGSGIGFLWWQKTKVLESEGNFGISGVKTEFLESRTLDKVFIVKGNIINGYKVPKSFLRVKATIISKDNKVLATKVVYAGNVFSQAEIKELSYSEIAKGLSNKMGKSMMNVDVQPGKSLPFMVVFEQLPPEAATLEVEAL